MMESCQTKEDGTSLKSPQRNHFPDRPAAPEKTPESWIFPVLLKK
jgi:hypothetical protein